MVDLTSLDALSVAVQGARSDIAEMKGDIREMTATMAKLMVIEQQHLETKHAMDRAFSRIEDVEERLRPIEVALPGLIETRKWVVALLLAAFGLMFLAVAALVFRPPATVLPIVQPNAHAPTGMAMPATAIPNGR